MWLAITYICISLVLRLWMLQYLLSCRPKCCELSRLGIESWFFGESFLIVILWFPEVNMIIPDRFHMFLSCKNYFSFYETTKTSKRCFRITSNHPSLMVCKSVEIWSLFIHFFQNRWLLLIVFVSYVLRFLSFPLDVNVEYFRISNFKLLYFKI